MKRSVWYAAEAIISGEASEAAEYGLMEAGALGTETSVDPTASLTVRGYFETSPTLPPCALLWKMHFGFTILPKRR